MKRVLLCAAILGLTGCGAIFPYESSGGCPQTENGVCAGLRTVYNGTNVKDHLGPSDLAPAPARASSPPATQSGQPAGASPASAASGADGASVPTALPGYAGVLPVSMTGDGGLPLRTMPTVMRIWIAPYVDAAGDLEMPGYVFTELTARQWQFGGAALEPQSGGLRPLDAGAVLRAGSGSNAGSGAAGVPGAPLPPAVGRTLDVSARPPGSGLAGTATPATWQVAPGQPAVR